MMLTLKAAYAPRAAKRMAQMINDGEFIEVSEGPSSSTPPYEVRVPSVIRGGGLVRCGPDQLPCVLVNGGVCLFDLYIRACFPEPFCLPVLPGLVCCAVCDALRAGRATFLDIGVRTDGQVVLCI
jgi:hypothetical protein